VSDRVHGKDAEARFSCETVVQIYTTNGSMRANAERPISLIVILVEYVVEILQQTHSPSRYDMCTRI